MKMRRDGTLPYGWLVDTSRSGIFVNTFTSPGGIHRDRCYGNTAPIRGSDPNGIARSGWIRARLLASFKNYVMNMR